MSYAWCLFEYLRNGNSFLWAALLLYSVFYFLLTKKRTNIPGPTGLPLVGYVPFLGKDPRLKLLSLSKKYGKIFGLYLGRTYVVVVTDVDDAKKLFNKQTVQDRTKNAFALMPDGVGFVNLNGNTWMEQRRYTVRQMKDLGFSGSSWEKLVQDEVKDFLNLVKETNGESINIDKPLSASISNNVLSLVSGHRLPMGDSGRVILDEGIESFQTLYDQSGIINFFPFLFKVAVWMRILNVRHMLKDMNKMNSFVKKIIDKCKAEGQNCYISNYAKEMEERRNLAINNSFTDSHLTGNVQALIIAGSDTTKLSLTWLFYAMATYPDIQDKIHEELDGIFSELKIACWNDRHELPYCQATILEGQRWKTIVPLNLLHRTSQDTEIQGYVIPKNTDVMAMLWAFHNDTNYWKNPEKFVPERFLTDDGKGIKQCESYAPFSLGKRICPGETVAQIEIFIYFTAVMQRFRILPDKEGELPDLEGITGLTYQPKRQQLRFVSRTSVESC